MDEQIWSLTKTVTVKVPDEKRHRWRKESESWEFPDFGEARDAFRRLARECATTRSSVFDGDGNIRNLKEMFEREKEGIASITRRPGFVVHVPPKTTELTKEYANGKTRGYANGEVNCYRAGDDERWVNLRIQIHFDQDPHPHGGAPIRVVGRSFEDYAHALEEIRFLIDGHLSGDFPWELGAWEIQAQGSEHA